MEILDVETDVSPLYGATNIFNTVFENTHT